MFLSLWFIGDSLSEEVALTLPKDVIEGSARSTVSVIGNIYKYKQKLGDWVWIIKYILTCVWFIGDILGRALRNLHGLLRMPYGCGEQNMAVLSPNIYILQYLENTEQLTSAIRERATGFLKSGERHKSFQENTENKKILRWFDIKLYIFQNT